MAITRLINPARLDNPKTLTREDVAKRQERAISFARNVVGDPELADELANMSVEEYAAKKNFRLENPHHEKENNMAVRQERTSGLTEEEVNELRQIIRQSRSGSAERTERLSNPRRLANHGSEVEAPSLSRTARLAKKLRTDRDELVDALQEISDLLDSEDYETASEIVDEVLCEYDPEEE
jgi:hypothetical protein